MASTLSIIPRNLTLFLRPRSTNPDQAFRERTIRVAALLLLVITILSIIASFTVYGNTWVLASYPTILTVMAVILVGSLIMLERQQIYAAGIFLIAAFLEAMCGILLIEGYWAFLILPILMLTLIIAAMVLPSRLLWLTGL